MKDRWSVGLGPNILGSLREISAQVDRGHPIDAPATARNPSQGAAFPLSKNLRGSGCPADIVIGIATSFGASAVLTALYWRFVSVRSIYDAPRFRPERRPEDRESVQSIREMSRDLANEVAPRPAWIDRVSEAIACAPIGARYPMTLLMERADCPSLAFTDELARA